MRTATAGAAVPSNAAAPGDVPAGVGTTVRPAVERASSSGTFASPATTPAVLSFRPSDRGAPTSEPAAVTTTGDPATAATARAAAPSLADAGLPSATAWTTAARRARSFARSRGARTRFAIRVDGRPWSFRGHETTHSNSLIKATVLVAYLRRGSVRRRALTGRERALLTPMIRESANGPVNTLIGMMGGLEPLRQVGRRVGMEDFRPVAGLWGASRISAADEARLFAQLYSVLPPRHRTYALDLLGSIVPSQRWGMPKAAPRGWKVRFKSGWNGRGRVLQAMRLTCKGHVISVSVLVDGGSHGGSIDVVERTGRRLLQPLRVRGRKACSSVVRTPPG